MHGIDLILSWTGTREHGRSFMHLLCIGLTSFSKVKTGSSYHRNSVTNLSWIAGTLFIVETGYNEHRSFIMHLLCMPLTLLFFETGWDEHRSSSLRLLCIALNSFLVKTGSVTAKSSITHLCITLTLVQAETGSL